MKVVLSYHTSLCAALMTCMAVLCMSEDMRFVEWDRGELTRQDHILLDMVEDRSPDNLRKRFHE